MKYANEGIKQLHKYGDTFKFERRIIDLQFKASQAWPLKIASFVSVIVSNLAVKFLFSFFFSSDYL